jgi:hypothetical protein
MLYLSAEFECRQTSDLSSASKASKRSWIDSSVRGAFPVRMWLKSWLMSADTLAVKSDVASKLVNTLNIKN